jgi:NAD(P)-dependent dehydrogenase (short-subunit alcohol dehydrogenase family)
VRVAGSAGRVLSVSDVKAQQWSAPISMRPRARRQPRKFAPPAVDYAIAATVREFGRLDVLADCVGVNQTATFLDLDPGEWERVIAVNLTCMSHLRQQAGTADGAARCSREHHQSHLASF